jgi:hypothetical protein
LMHSNCPDRKVSIPSLCFMGVSAAALMRGGAADAICSPAPRC